MRVGLRELIFLVVLLAVPITSFIYVFKPRNEQIRRAREEIQIKQTQLEALEKVTSRIPDLGLAIAEGQQALDLIEKQLPSEEGVDEILRQITEIAKRNKLSVPKVEGQRPVPFGQYMELPLKTVIEGTFDGFYQFLLDLEDLSRITRIHQMKLARLIPKNPKDEEYPPGTMRAEFTLSIYYSSRNGQPLPEEPAPAKGKKGGRK
ncbi:MAG: type 4a pilus biogenesis protein PilO [Phycisphaerales bacterium]|nr:type 4a pilus biogenesis protein PilO [Phycisphaerales bacterium]